MKEIVAALGWFLRSMSTWLRCAAHPIRTLNIILSDEQVNLDKVVEIWIPSLLVSIVVSLPVLKLFGIEWNNVGYHLSQCLVAFAALAIEAFITHLFLLMFGLRSNFLSTLLMYSIPVVSYGPITGLLAVPATLKIFYTLQDAKLNHVSFGDLINKFILSGQDSSLLTGISGVVVGFLSVFSCVILTVFTESLCQWYGNSRFKCYFAVTASTVVSTAIVLLVVTPFQLLVMYAYEVH